MTIKGKKLSPAFAVQSFASRAMTAPRWFCPSNQCSWCETLHLAPEERSRRTASWRTCINKTTGLQTKPTYVPIYCYTSLRKPTASLSVEIHWWILRRCIIITLGKHCTRPPLGNANTDPFSVLAFSFASYIFCFLFFASLQGQC